MTTRSGWLERIGQQAPRNPGGRGVSSGVILSSIKFALLSAAHREKQEQRDESRGRLVMVSEVAASGASIGGSSRDEVSWGPHRAHHSSKTRFSPLALPEAHNRHPRTSPLNPCRGRESRPFAAPLLTSCDSPSPLTPRATACRAPPPPTPKPSLTPSPLCLRRSASERTMTPTK